MSKMYTLFIIIIILYLIQLTTCQKTYTKLQLKGLHQELIDKLFASNIQAIVEKVVYKAQSQDKVASYRHIYSTSEGPYEMPNNKSDQVIIDHLQAILIDAGITISNAKCPYMFGSSSSCKEIVVEW